MRRFIAMPSRCPVVCGQVAKARPGLLLGRQIIPCYSVQILPYPFLTAFRQIGQGLSNQRSSASVIGRISTMCSSLEKV